MAYSTASEVRTLLRGFNDPLGNGDGSGVDPDFTPAQLLDAQIEYEISNADEQINSVLRRRYALPLPEPVPVVLKNLSIDIAAALCDMTFRGSREYASVISPPRLRYERAMLILDRIATGDYPLYNDGEGPAMSGDESIVINPYPGDVLLTTEVFPRGRVGFSNEVGGEYGSSSLAYVPYYPYLRYG